MAGFVKFGTLARTERAQAIADLINLDSSSEQVPLLQLYGGAQPSGPDDDVTDQPLIAQAAMSYPCEETVVDGVLTFAPIGDALALVGDEITWGRIVRGSTQVPVLDFPVGLEGSGSVIELKSTVVLIGVNVQITQATITEP